MMKNADTLTVIAIQMQAVMHQPGQGSVLCRKIHNPDEGGC